MTASAAGDAQRKHSKSRTLLVSTIGVDGVNCGDVDHPCRTINVALGNARDGDTVLVEPGQYGDLNRDGDQDDTGEEHAPVPSRCIICIDKRVELYSTHGADVTTINDFRSHAVLISADHVVFGGRGKGFTITGSGGGAVVVELAGDVHVSGNTVRNASVGFFFQAERGPIYVRNNVALENYTAGMLATTSRNGGTGYVELSNNSLIDNGANGMGLDGFVAHEVSDNSITGSYTGLEVRNNSRVTGNVIRGNVVGVLVTETGEAIDAGVLGGGVRLSRNAILDNEDTAIEFSVESAAPNHQVHFNAIFGNGGRVRERSEFIVPPNCGVLNRSGGLVDATRNFWGAASGPGPDPADRAGSAPCDVSGSTKVVPYATSRLSPGFAW